MRLQVLFSSMDVISSSIAFLHLGLCSASVKDTWHKPDCPDDVVDATEAKRRVIVVVGIEVVDIIINLHIVVVGNEIIVVDVIVNLRIVIHSRER
jgi:hypothetical protein